MKKKILFLCTENAARSQMAEAILNMQYGERFIAHSAGANPVNQVNPYAIKTMNQIGIDISNKKPKSADIFANEEFDFIITLCDKSKEQCVNFSGKPIFAHWLLPDPANFTGTDAEITHKFSELLKLLTVRIGYLANLPLDKLDRLSLAKRAEEIGTIS